MVAIEVLVEEEVCVCWAVFRKVSDTNFGEPRKATEKLRDASLSFSFSVELQ